MPRNRNRWKTRTLLPIGHREIQRMNGDDFRHRISLFAQLINRQTNVYFLSWKTVIVLDTRHNYFYRISIPPLGYRAYNSPAGDPAGSLRLRVSAVQVLFLAAPVPVTRRNFRFTAWLRRK